RLYRRACDAEDGGGCSSLGWLYERGEVVSKNVQLARNLYIQGCKYGERLPENAVFNNGRIGCFFLGLLFLIGGIVKLDLVRAAELFRASCETDTPIACTELGRQYENGSGVTRDLARARELYDRACKSAVPEGCALLGRLYANGLGMEPDFSRAKGLLE